MDSIDDLIFTIEANDDDTEILLIVTSLNGRKINQHEFIMALEGYLHEVTQAETYRIRTGALTH
jgi:hypothetical protein